MPASTSTPIAIAIPPSDMMFDVMPKTRMRRNDVRIASGSGSVTMRIERKCSRKITCASVTRRISSRSARRSVPTAREISAERS